MTKQEIHRLKQRLDAIQNPMPDPDFDPTDGPICFECGSFVDVSGERKDGDLCHSCGHQILLEIIPGVLKLIEEVGKQRMPHGHPVKGKI